MPSDPIKLTHISQENRERAANWFTHFNEYYVIAQSYLSKEFTTNKDNLITITLALMDRAFVNGQYGIGPFAMTNAPDIPPSVPPDDVIGPDGTAGTGSATGTTVEKSTESDVVDAPVDITLEENRCGLISWNTLSEAQKDQATQVMMKIKSGKLIPKQVLLEKLDSKDLDGMSYGILKDMAKHYGVKNIFTSLDPIPDKLLDEFVAIMFGYGRLYRWQ